MTPDAQEPTIQQLREEMALLRGELDQLSAQLARVDVRTTSHGQALDDIETYLTQTAQLARDAAEQARSTAEQAAIGNTPDAAEHAAGTANDTTEVTTGHGLDMTTLVPWWKTTSPP